MAQVSIPPPYRGPTQGRGEIETTGTTLRECLEDAGRQYPGLAEQIFDAAGKVHRFVNVFVNGDEIPRDQIDRKVADTDRIEILAAIAGG